MRRLFLQSICLFTAAQLIGGPPVHSAQNYKVWTDNGGGPDNSHFSALSQITKENVGKLDVAWSYPSNDTISCVWNPLIVGNVMYVLARNNSAGGAGRDHG